MVLYRFKKQLFFFHLKDATLFIYLFIITFNSCYISHAYQ